MTELERLTNEIEEASRLYYQTGNSPLTDAEYDRLVEKATRLGYIEKVGAEPLESIAKIEHEHPMLSLAKCHSAHEVLAFANNQPVVVMDKADGLSLSATYIDGVLVRLETRGNGAVGNDVLFQAKSIENLPLFINKLGKYVIDGECVILYSDFEKINNKLNEAEKYSHPRNLAAGSLSLLDNKISAKRHLRFYAWDVIEGGGNSLSDNLIEAGELGFQTVNFWVINKPDELHIEASINHIIEIAGKRFPIDGVVFKYDNIAYGDSLGMTDHHKRSGIAYKMKDETYPTTLKSVEWQCGKTGQLTPVANFADVIIDNTVINKASLHNISIMKELGVTNGCTCYVKKCNAIIPQIDSVDDDGDGDIEIPATCPVCGGKTKIIKDNNSEVLMCTNDNCPGKVLGKMKAFVAKKGMDIDGLSEATLDKFLKRGYLTDKFASIYSLGNYRRELCKLDGFGAKSVDNLLKTIEDSRDVDLTHFITALSIPGIGEGQAKLITAKFPTFEEFEKACTGGYDFTKIPGFGSVLSSNVRKWVAANHDELMNLAALMRFKNDFMNPPEGDFPLSGKTFVVTGSVHHFKNRDELSAKIEALGGKVAGSVSKNTSYLINNDVNSMSGKNKKAKELKVPIITEEEFLGMIG